MVRSSIYLENILVDSCPSFLQYMYTSKKSAMHGDENFIIYIIFCLLDENIIYLKMYT